MVKHAQKHTRAGLAMIAAAALAFSGACTPSFEGEYQDPNARAEMLDDTWNEDDAKITANKIILQMLYENWQDLQDKPGGTKIERAWLKKYKAKLARKKGISAEEVDGPVIIFKNIANKTSEHIPISALNEAIRHELVNSGQVRFSSMDELGDEMVKQLKYQADSGMVSAESAKAIGKQVGADFFLTGSLNSQEHSLKGQKRVSYETNLVLTDIENALISWSGKADIRKSFRRSSWGG
jgi:uncharacterized protein (TIGR02722 family)